MAICSGATADQNHFLQELLLLLDLLLCGHTEEAYGWRSGQFFLKPSGEASLLLRDMPSSRQTNLVAFEPNPTMITMMIALHPSISYTAAV